MLDSDNVLPLRSVGPQMPIWERPPAGAEELPSSLYVVTIYRVEGDDFAGFFLRKVVPVLVEAEMSPIGCMETEPAENDFPRLPVRTGEKVFVWFARFETPEEEREVDLPMLESRLAAPPERLRLRPTARSSLR